MNQNTTICAIATPAGNGAIAVIRLSGEEAIPIGEKIFYPAQKGKSLSAQQGNTIHYGTLKDGDEIVDDVLIGLFRAPHSYTGEDVLEISCHGSVYIQQRIIELLINHGARTAKPGEFTQRAFLNGKMDLTQAEAVADIIAATSQAEHKLAFSQLRGGISGEIANLRQELLNFASLIELELDFSEEDVEFADRKELTRLIASIQRLISGLLQSFKTGNAIKKGIPVAIVGKPNAGKSTLLNLLLKEDKAIVSEIEGTTRDVIEDMITIEGVNFRLIDTAGLRKTTDKIETLGIQKTLENVKKATIVVLLVDSRETIEDIGDQVASLSLDEGRQLMVLLNKTDLSDDNSLRQQNLQALHDKGIKAFPISALSGEGIDQLNHTLIELAHLDAYNSSDVILTNARHYEALKNSDQALLRVLENLKSELPTDFLAQDIREALHYLGEITGQITTDEILGNIFKNFCIGK
jgi:tRNA modification GTPase